MWNRRYAEVYARTTNAIQVGGRFEDAVRAGLAAGVYPEAKGREDEWLAERLAYHAQANSTHEQRMPDNRWLRICERRTADGGSVGIRIDISELKQREEPVRTLFEFNPVPMFVFDCDDLNFLAVNDAAVRHYGYSREQFLGMTNLDIHLPKSANHMPSYSIFSATPSKLNSSRRPAEGIARRAAGIFWFMSTAAG